MHEKRDKEIKMALWNLNSRKVLTGLKAHLHPTEASLIILEEQKQI
jgi:hypothetical protein